MTLKEVSPVTEENVYIFSALDELDKYENCVSGTNVNDGPATYTLNYSYPEN